MIDVGKFQGCVCQSRSNPHSLCDGSLRFEENGIKVAIEPKAGEEAVAIVVDGCICKDSLTKCDGIFLYKRQNRRWIILVELKGSDVEHAFEQLAYMKNHRSEYKEIYELFKEENNYQVSEAAFIVSNHILSLPEQQKLEISNGIRVKRILFSAATKPIPDVTNYL